MKEKKRNQIMKAAEQLFESRRFHEVTMEESPAPPVSAKGPFIVIFMTRMIYFMKLLFRATRHCVR